MSRIGRMPITIPAGVDVTIAEGNHVTVKGPKGTLERSLSPKMTIRKDGNVIHVTRPDDERESRSLHGLTKTLLNNMVVGRDRRVRKRLEIVGVGYRAVKAGKTLQLFIGYSQVNGLPQAKYCLDEGDGISFEVPDSNTILVKGADKQKVGEVAAQIRAKRPPEPYLGKGIKYANEVIRRKAGKTGK